MRILAHRGLWHNPEEKNTFKAFTEAFKNGFGVETDFRDYCGQLVIAHDLADSSNRSLSDFLQLHQDLGRDLLLALNVKADGLQGLCSELLKRFAVRHYFVFDCSVPDLLSYQKRGIAFYSRQSELEKEASLYAAASGVWLDELVGPWIDESAVMVHLERGKQVCLVSPELHGRPHQQAWQTYKNILIKHRALADTSLAICTDFPIQAREYFSG